MLKSESWPPLARVDFLACARRLRRSLNCDDDDDTLANGRPIETASERRGGNSAATRARASSSSSCRRRRLRRRRRRLVHSRRVVCTCRSLASIREWSIVQSRRIGSCERLFQLLRSSQPVKSRIFLSSSFLLMCVTKAAVDCHAFG